MNRAGALTEPKMCLIGWKKNTLEVTPNPKYSRFCINDSKNDVIDNSFFQKTNKKSKNLMVSVAYHEISVKIPFFWIIKHKKETRKHTKKHKKSST